jgi:hypothetical protein
VFCLVGFQSTNPTNHVIGSISNNSIVNQLSSEPLSAMVVNCQIANEPGETLQNLLALSVRIYLMQSKKINDQVRWARLCLFMDLNTNYKVALIILLLIHTYKQYFQLSEN